ncbi:MAG: hypothetical protein JKY65_30695 [Planctomycetes bacterium]|nr:hypothetical protein [Planctomycetota bacterium]
MVPRVAVFLLSLSLAAWAGEAEDLLAAGKQHLLEGKFSDAVTSFRKAKAGGAEGADELLTLGRSLRVASRRLRARQLPEAKEALATAAAIAVDHPQLVGLRTELKRYDDLLAQRGSLPGKALTKRTKHFRIEHHQPYLATSLAKDAERYLAEIEDGLAYPGMRRPKLKPLRLQILRDRAAYLREAGPLGKVSTGMVVTPTHMLTFQRAAPAVLKHELTHMVIHRWLPNMPLWVHEGLASGGYQQARSEEYARALKHLEQKQLMTLEDLFRLPDMGAIKISRAAFYLQCRLLSEFFLFAAGDLERFHRFARSAKERSDEAIKEWARNQKGGGRLVVDPLKFVAEAMLELLPEFYGYEDLSALEPAFGRYLAHRAREAKVQAKERPLACDFKARRLESTHVVLFTTCTEKVARPLLALAERVRQAFYTEFWDAGIVTPKRIKVYLFEHHREYAAYLKARGMLVEQGRWGALPHFNPRLGAACLYRAKLSKDYLSQTLAHEVAHALSWNLMPRAVRGAPWLLEGIAHYVGLSVHHKSGAIELGQIHETKKSKVASYLEVMRRGKKLVPLPAFVGLGFGGLRTIGSHVQCWGLFHFLQHANEGVYRERFHQFIAQIAAGAKGLPAFEKHLGSAKELDEVFERYVRELEPTSKRR